MITTIASSQRVSPYVLRRKPSCGELSGKSDKMVGVTEIAVLASHLRGDVIHQAARLEKRTLAKGWFSLAHKHKHTT